MKKAILFTLLFLVNCQGQPTDMEQSAPMEQSPMMDVFEVSEQCPHVCWLGINPGVTITEDAIVMLRASDHIDQTRFRTHEDSIEVFWILEEYPDYPISMLIESKNGVVNRIDSGSTPFTVGDFVQYLGEPDQIYLRQERAPEEDYIKYFIGFSPYRLTLEGWDIDWEGPIPGDRILRISLNDDLESSLPPAWGDPQPWLGYGHIEEYMPGLIIRP